MTGHAPAKDYREKVRCGACATDDGEWFPLSAAQLLISQRDTLAYLLRDVEGVNMVAKVKGLLGAGPDVPVGYCLLCCASNFEHDEVCRYADFHREIHGLCPGGPIPEGSTCEVCNMSWQTLQRLAYLQRAVAEMYIQYQTAYRVAEKANAQLMGLLP